MKPYISICIPTFERIDYLRRLLESICIQKFEDFEVIITDDSNDNSVKNLIQFYKDNFIIKYYKNEPPLGTPANWNVAISKAEGQWIKLMHDDDWFASSESLLFFANSATGHRKFIFSSYYAVEEGGARKIHKLSFNQKKIIRQPFVLFAKNLIGPPSTTLIHRSITEQYDERLKWRVDVEFYMRVLENEQNFVYINKPLINIGMNPSQVTASSINNPKIELPEAWLLLEKYGVKPLRNIKVYDAWWRMFRNMGINSEKKLNFYIAQKWPAIILSMVNDIQRIPLSILKIGIFSKFFMGISYLKNKNLVS
jgi:glycosyltransferase involved in cell wall biosynthesis